MTESTGLQAGTPVSALLAGLVVVLSAAGWSQPRADAPSATFEVAVVKPGGVGQPSMRVSPAQLSMQNATLRQLVKYAYGVQDYQLAGPAWIDSTTYSVFAKPPASTPMKQLGPMLQALLAERLRLTVHREPRLMPGFALTVGEKGPKLRKTEGGDAMTTVGRGFLKVENESMSAFAELLAGQLQRPVEDRTGLQGVFGFRLEWAPEQTPPADLRGSAAPPVVNASDPIASIFDALQDQLGLRLRVQPVSVQVLVIDHAEKVPIGN